ncbi:MAG: histidine phosphatase family protein [Candidatus Spechtbacterales bacterium]|nr:histidine phosphatase family protein [Candidatus Spechtbacterales bacterium]
MDSPQRLVLVRHAESTRNKAPGNGVFFPDEKTRKGFIGEGDHDISLTPEGVEQAQITAPHISKWLGNFDHAYHSGYLRTIQTLTYILGAYDLQSTPIKQHESTLIREQDAGHAFNMTEAEVKKSFPWLQQYLKTFGPFYARPPGGESLPDVIVRVQIFLEMISRKHSGKNILVITHGGTLSCFRFVLENWTPARLIELHNSKTNSPANCGVTLYEYSAKNEGLVLREYNKVFW